jgi:hypothetical protein
VKAFSAPAEIAWAVPAEMPLGIGTIP